MRGLVSVVAGCLWVGCLSVTAAKAEMKSADERPWFDTHVHLVDFFQEGSGAAELLAAMDAAGVESAFVFGTPLLKSWHSDAPQRPRYYLGDESSMYYYSATDAIVAEAVQKLPAAQRQRLYPFISGFNPTDMNAADHVRRMLELYPGLWRGIGEVLTRHDDLTALTEGEVARADHPALMRVYKLAAEEGLPVMLHSNITSKREKEPLYLEELQTALEKNPRTHFIWAHAGASASLHRYQGAMPFLRDTVEQLLRQHDNLWIDLSWAMLDEYLLQKGKPDPEWVALVKAYPDRFLLGSDALGSFDKLGESLQAFTPFLDALPKEVAQQLAYGNAEALLRRVDADPS